VGYACAGMRCASCGTQNEPDSRFCGGCGARLSAGESRLAPTQKVTGGAHEVQARVQAMTPAPQPVVPTTPVPGMAMAPGIPPTPIPAPIPVTPPPSMSMLDTLPPRMSGQQAARAPSAPQGVTPRAASEPLAVPAGPPSGPMAAPFGSEPPRIASSVRGVPAPGPGGIPGTGGGVGGIPGTGVGRGGIPGTGVGGIPGTGIGRGGIPGTGTGAGAGPGGIPGMSGVPASARPVALPSAPSLRARTGLVIGVLVVDLALALAGGWLLSRGLSESDASPHPPAPPPRAAPPSPS